MSTPKGYPNVGKEERLNAEFSSVEPIREKQSGLSVLSHGFVFQVGTDAVEANSSTSIIVATSHAAKRGDIIRFTSGALSGQEVKVWSTSTNEITLAQDLSSAPSAAVTFEILRHKYPVVDSDGVLQTATTITGVATEATLQNIEADVALIEAKDFATQTTLASVQSDTASIAAKDFATETTLSAMAGDVAALTGEDFATETTLSAISAKDFATETTLALVKTAVETIDNAISGTEMQVDVVTLPGTVESNIASIAAEDFATETTLAGAAASLTSIASEDFATEVTLSAVKTAVEKIDDAIAGSEMQVDVVTLPSLPAGTNNIGDVDVLTLPSLPAGTNNIGDVDVLTLPSIPAGSNLIGSVDTNLDVIDFIDTTPVLDTSSSNITASSGNPLQIVSSLAAAVKKIRVSDTTGEFIGVYTGAALSEVLQCVIGPGMDGDIEVRMSASERVSLRNMANSAISTGKVCIQFLG